MDPWKRYRLIAYIVVMLGMLVAGGVSRLLVGVPEFLYGPSGYYHPVWEPVPGDRTMMRLVENPRTTDPFLELGRFFPSPPVHTSTILYDLSTDEVPDEKSGVRK